MSVEAKREAKQFPLKLENGETVTCSMSGQGSRIGYIAGGPGSFYFKGLSALAGDYTFITCDSEWTYRKIYDPRFVKKEVKVMTKESIKERDHLVVEALKEHFKVTKIDGFGFSGPGAVLLEEAADYPEDYDHIIGTGVGVTELDPTFSKTTALFNSRATPERKKTFEEHQERYKKFQSIIGNDVSVIDKKLFASFDFKPDGKAATKFQQKPHKRFVAESMTMVAKLFFKYDDEEQIKAKLIDHWKHNPFKEHVDKRFQEHFFANIYPLLKPLQTVIELAKSGKRILLVYGETDFITPLPPEILAILKQHPSITVKILDRCGHVPYMESPAEYRKTVMDFVDAAPTADLVSEAPLSIPLRSSL